MRRRAWQRPQASAVLRHPWLQATATDGNGNGPADMILPEAEDPSKMSDAEMLIKPPDAEDVEAVPVPEPEPEPEPKPMREVKEISTTYLNTAAPPVAARVQFDVKEVNVDYFRHGDYTPSKTGYGPAARAYARHTAAATESMA